MQIVLETIIAAPATVVFSTLVDVGRWAQFMSGIGSVEILTPGPLALGTRFRETRTMFGRDRERGDDSRGDRAATSASACSI